MALTKQYKVGRLSYRIVFEDENNSPELLPSSKPFETDVDFSVPVIFTLTVNDSFRPQTKGKEVGQFDCGGANHGVYLLEGGAYQFLLSDVWKRKCCLIETNSDLTAAIISLRGDNQMRSYGLNNCIMMMYAFSAARQNTLLVHASVIMKDNKGYLFLGKSGTGKSTHTSNWMKYIPETELMNDDNPVIRFIDGVSYVFGSPWSGKTPCYKNIEAPIGGFVQLEQAPFNKIRKMNTIETFASLLPSCSVMKWDKNTYGGVCDTLSRIMETTSTYFLQNLPDRDAVMMSYSTLVGKSNSDNDENPVRS